MKITVNGKQAGTKENGCALCGATWGDWHETILGQDLFFCCDICADEFKHMLDHAAGHIDLVPDIEITLEGNYQRGRDAIIRSGTSSLRFYIKFGPGATVEKFEFKK